MHWGIVSKLQLIIANMLMAIFVILLDQMTNL